MDHSEQTRVDGRTANQLRPVSIELGPQRNPEGSVLYRSGNTSVLIACSVEEKVPPFMADQGRGWVTAEYAMHPRANPDRRQKRTGGGKIDGRSQEIQRLIGRSLRAGVVFEKLGERTFNIDCDVLDADGGTRTASITGATVALMIALDKLVAKGKAKPGVVLAPIAAVSVGLVDSKPLLDLPYSEDSRAQVDLNVVASAGGGIVEVQGTAEGTPMTRKELDTLVDLAMAGCDDLFKVQSQTLEAAGVDVDRLLGK